MPAPASLLALLFLLFGAGAAWSKPVTLDDSGSTSLEPNVSMRWKTHAPSRGASQNLLVGATTIRVRINVAPWVKRSGRIYLVLPQQSPGPVNASWSTQGRLMPGQVASGNRVLVYSGPITAPFIEDLVTFEFSVDASLMARAYPVSFHFEMDE